MQSGYGGFKYGRFTETLFNSARVTRTKLEGARGSRLKRFFTAMEYRRHCKRVYKTVEVNSCDTLGVSMKYNGLTEGVQSSHRC
jgi:hypothetical protein